MAKKSIDKMVGQSKKKFKMFKNDMMNFFKAVAGTKGYITHQDLHDNMDLIKKMGSKYSM